MKEILIICVFVASFNYFLFVLSSFTKFIKSSIAERKLDKVAFKELLIVVFLGQYGLYRYLDEDDAVLGFKGSIVLSLLTLIGLAMLILPNTSYGSETIGSIFEKKNYVEYYNASIIYLDEDYSEISEELAGVAEVERTEDGYSLRTIFIKDKGTISIYYDYSIEDIHEIDEFSYIRRVQDYDGEQYSVRIFREKVKLKSRKELYTKVAGVTFTNGEFGDIRSRQDILQLVEDGNKEVLLIRDKNNEYDKDAVIVLSEYGIIGFINAELAPYVAELIDQGEILKGKVTEVTGGNIGQNYGCNLQLQSYIQIYE